MNRTGKRRKARRTAEQDFELFKEYQRVPNGKKAEFMRKHGLYPAEIVRIEDAVQQGGVGALEARRSRKKEQVVPASVLEERDDRIRELEGTLADVVTENRILKKKVNGV